MTSGIDAAADLSTAEDRLASLGDGATGGPALFFSYAPPSVSSVEVPPPPRRPAHGLLASLHSPIGPNNVSRVAQPAGGPLGTVFTITGAELGAEHPVVLLVPAGSAAYSLEAIFCSDSAVHSPNTAITASAPVTMGTGVYDVLVRRGTQVSAPHGAAQFSLSVDAKFGFDPAYCGGGLDFGVAVPEHPAAEVRLFSLPFVAFQLSKSVL